MMKFVTLSIAALSAAIFTLNSFAAETVNLYSARKEALIKPMLDDFTKQTGIEVRLLTGGGDALLTRLQAEGENTPADLFLTVDAGNLHRAAQAGVFQELGSPLALQAVPSQYHGDGNLWLGLSLRARPIFYAPDRVNPEQLSGYADLADNRWDNNVCIRSSDNIYNQSLTAALIQHWGEEKTEEWARGLVDNLAKPPVGGDRDQIKALANGVCDIAVANTYYLGVMEASDDAAEREAASKVKIFWPNQDDQGTHVNVSGIGLTKHAKNADNARRLVEFLLSPEAQQWYAEANNEYPIRRGVDWSDRLMNWGEFKMDSLPMRHLGENNADAVRLMNRAGWR
ncbi:iron(III) transport system substrate-binding protein [Pseudidiomarina planktonica]|uniref:Iron(III) transport system substrate-binding protein n=1 Tax=Pseudidiomarina planktonica TaxID=1323738 RepID=A0A1Y6EJS7_9GAMM|nr:Fe(3+) ABC transporter substrate-binding protein [Pseudidiomarina planktonica]RUO65773.1 Fe(3+) ABC transporter substrate-binding protein [Pseudidiomarina planktonica]SMQ62894.1 iron(III) transport system substrate-binding protein [Pseudidiomarina planktonica]